MTNTEKNQTTDHNDDAYDTCQSCGFDLGTHRPPCTGQPMRNDPDLWSLIQAAAHEEDALAELLAEQRRTNEASNPNRPTPQGYCYQGGHTCTADGTGAWEFTAELHKDECFYSPKPVTARRQESLDIAALIGTLSSEQRHSALMYLSATEHFAAAIEYARNYA